ncbi:MAG TPA: helix-turn-helix transcriptional regulator [Candidatus Dormibacteraeota bacterium]|jgi:DNA-binding Xre family transcriptional regulator
MPTVFRLAAVLERAGMSQSELARLSGLSLQTINRLCTNRTAQVSLATLDKIATALKVEPGELLERAKRVRK